LAGAIIGTTLLLSTEAGMAKTDAMLCACVTVAMCGLARIYLATRAGEDPRRPHKFLFWFGLGLSILIKGPIGLLVVAPAMIALSVWDRDIKWMKRLGWGWGLPLVALLVGPWAIAITIATDGGFWREAVGHDLGGKITGAAESHGGFPGLYLVLSPLLLFPATLLWPAALSAGWSRRAEPAVRFMVCWLVPAWLIFELAPTKLPHYTLPTFGAIALLMAAALTQPIGAISRRVGAGLTVFAAVVICGITVYGLTRWGTSTAQTWAAITILCTAVAGVGGAFILLNRAAVSALAVSIAFGVVAHAALAGTLRQLRPLSVAPLLVETMEKAGIAPDQGLIPGPVAITSFHEPSFVFLTGRDTQLTDAAGAARALAEGRPAIVEAHDAEAFRRPWPSRARAAGRSARCGLQLFRRRRRRPDRLCPDRRSGRAQRSRKRSPDEGAPQKERASEPPHPDCRGRPARRAAEREGHSRTRRPRRAGARLEAAGAKRIEAVSFVHPKYVPQMAGAEEVMAELPESGGPQPHRAGAQRQGL
jgi:4-amino-4-deoxy-L-arabinose transferase-like glycosyltransferase